MDKLRNVLFEDQIMQMNFFSMKQLYLRLVGKVIHEAWAQFCWNRISIPKHFMWLVMKQRMQTTKHLYRIGVCESLKC